MTKDVICGMGVDEKKALESFYNGKTYYFCSTTCKQTFDRNPKKFVK